MMNERSEMVREVLTEAQRDLGPWFSTDEPSDVLYDIRAAGYDLPALGYDTTPLTIDEVAAYLNYGLSR